MCLHNRDAYEHALSVFYESKDRGQGAPNRSTGGPKPAHQISPLKRFESPLTIDTINHNTDMCLPHQASSPLTLWVDGIQLTQIGKEEKVWVQKLRSRSKSGKKTFETNFLECGPVSANLCWRKRTSWASPIIRGWQATDATCSERSEEKERGNLERVFMGKQTD